MYDELQGGSDLMGLDDYEIGEDEFGRKVRVRRRRVAHPRQAQVQANRIEPLPINAPAAVAAGVLMQCIAYPQRKFKPLRLVLNDDTGGAGTFATTITAAGYTIIDIKIGSVSQLNNDGNLPGALFLPTSVGTSFSFGTAHVGNQVRVNAVHGDALNTHTLTGAFIGKSYFVSEI
jgi:hypothetical protein